MKVWIALNRSGQPASWTLAHTRKEAMDRATQCLMGYREYDRLGTLSKRWKHCYGQGCRIVRATVTLDETP